MKSTLRLVTVILCLLWAPISGMTQDYRTLFQSFNANTLTYDDKRFLQTALAFEGHYNGLIDGDWGQRSQTAMDAYARTEFGTAAEDWHIAFLTMTFLDAVDRDGWGMSKLDNFGLSMLYPYQANIPEPQSEYFVNWRHSRSSLSYSIGIHSYATVQNLHDYTESVHASRDELYILRRQSFAVTSATKHDGSILYTRSNLIDGAWHTVMLSANRGDIHILNAVAASIALGPPRELRVTPFGALETTVLQTLALLDEQSTPPTTPASTPDTNLTYSGTGFVVGLQGAVLTNAHVVRNCTVLTFDGQPATVISTSDVYDLALLNVPTWPGDAVATFSPSPAKLNSDVTAIGFPLSTVLSGLNVTRGAVSSNLGFGGDRNQMQITAPVQSGNSGGPLLAADGEVVGVVVSKLDAQSVAEATGEIPQNVNFAIRGEIAKLFLFQNGIDPVLGIDDEVLAPEAIAENAMEYTGFIECVQ